MRKLFFSLLLTLVACSPGGSSTSSTDRTQQYLDERETLLKEYSYVVGSYSGQINAYKPNPDPNSNTEYVIKQIPLELGIYTEDVPNGKDDNGRTMFLPTLRIRYRQLDTVRPDMMLEGRFIADTREFNAASSDGSTTLRSTLQGTSLLGQIIRNGGKLGDFSLTLKSREVAVPYADAASDLYNRTVFQYKNIIGRYTGMVYPPKQGAISDKFPVQLDLSYTTLVVNGVLTPQLKAIYTRLDYPADDVNSTRQLDVSYRLDTDPAMLMMSAQGGTPTIPNAYYMSLSGLLENNVYTSDLYTVRGFIGTLVVTRKNR